jgi:hypothetical protein
VEASSASSAGHPIFRKISLEKLSKSLYECIDAKLSNPPVILILIGLN